MSNPRTTISNVEVGRYWFLMNLGLYETAEFKYFDLNYFKNNLDVVLGRYK